MIKGFSNTNSEVSPSLTSFPSNANVAFTRNRSYNPSGSVNSPPESLLKLMTLITSTFLDVSALTLFVKSVKDTNNNENTIDR